MTENPMIQRQGCFTAASLGPRAAWPAGTSRGRMATYSVKAARNESAAAANAGRSSTPITRSRPPPRATAGPCRSARARGRGPAVAGAAPGESLERPVDEPETRAGDGRPHGLADERRHGRAGEDGGDKKKRCYERLADTPRPPEPITSSPGRRRTAPGRTRRTRRSPRTGEGAESQSTPAPNPSPTATPASSRNATDSADAARTRRTLLPVLGVFWRHTIPPGRGLQMGSRIPFSRVTGPVRPLPTGPVRPSWAPCSALRGFFPTPGASGSGSPRRRER